MLRDAAPRSPAGGQASQPVVLDVRNGYEHDAGHFRGAERPVEVRAPELVQRCCAVELFL